MSKNYDDIINMEHPTSNRHPRMSMENRAAQFSPFAALTGLEDSLDLVAKEKEALYLKENIKDDIS